MIRKLNDNGTGDLYQIAQDGDTLVFLQFKVNGQIDLQIRDSQYAFSGHITMNTGGLREFGQMLIEAADRRGAFIKVPKIDRVLERVAENVSQLNALLQDPQPGLSSWCSMYGRCMDELVKIWHPDTPAEPSSIPSTP